MSSHSAAAQSLQARVAAELWTSFVALVRSYAAAGDLAKPPAKRMLIDEGNRALTLRGEYRSLTLRFDDGAGQGQWAVNENGPGGTKVLESGTFQFDEDSRVSVNDLTEKQELEVAAEKFASKVFDEE